MGKITVETCEIEGLKVITPTVFGDERGYFMETYNYNDYKEAGIDMEFVQDNQSASKKGVLRGLHFLEKRIQNVWKMVWCPAFRREQKAVLYSEEFCTWLSGAL